MEKDIKKLTVFILLLSIVGFLLAAFTGPSLLAYPYLRAYCFFGFGCNITAAMWLLKKNKNND